MVWEWCGLVTNEKHVLSYFIQSLTILLSIFMAANNWFLLSFFVLILGISLFLSLSFIKYIAEKNAFWLSVGTLYIGVPSIAMIWFRQDGDTGLWAVLYLFLLVWVTDSMAFFGGRFIGGAKLWPSISPNKTWAGFIGGLFGSLCVGLCFALIFDKADILSLSLISMALGTVAQIGDLAESAFKRNFGTKDSSSLIPGHGGILDRVDSMVFSVLFAALFALVINIQKPAIALLFN